MGLFESMGGPGAAIGAGSALLQGVAGLIQQGKAAKMRRGLKDPGYVIPSDFGKNLGIAEQMARVGMPSEQYNQAQTNIQRGTQSGLRQLGRMSNPFAAIQGLARGQQEAGLNLDVANANARRQNILAAMGSRRELAGQKLAKQQYAQQSYMDKVNQANALRGAGAQNVAGGLGTIANVGMTAMSAFGRKEPSTIDDTTTSYNSPNYPSIPNRLPYLDTSRFRSSFPTIGTPRTP